MHEFIEKQSASPSFHRFRPCLCTALSVIAMPLLADESVIISEFMANNRLAKKTGNLAMVDEDNSREDWIEIFNAGPAAVELDGWSLTDDATDLEKWTFPAKLLAPGQRLIVWASSKDRRDPAKPLHTNFKLDDDGEFLALVHPDGVDDRAPVRSRLPSAGAGRLLWHLGRSDPGGAGRRGIDRQVYRAG